MKQTQNVGREVLAVTFIATFVMLWNMLTGEYTDLVGLVHPGIMRGQFTPSLALPMSPFTLSSGFLGLLLGMYSIVFFFKIYKVIPIYARIISFPHLIFGFCTNSLTFSFCMIYTFLIHSFTLI